MAEYETAHGAASEYEQRQQNGRNEDYNQENGERGRFDEQREGQQQQNVQNWQNSSQGNRNSYGPGNFPQLSKTQIGTTFHKPTNSYLAVTPTGPLNTVGATNRLAGSMALSRDHDYVAENKKSNPFYKTTSNDYNPKWMLTQDNTIKDYTVPTFEELLAQRQKYFKMEKTLKNEFTNRENQKLKDAYESKLTEYDRMKLKFDRNAVVAKDFPFKPEEFKKPDMGKNVGNELYMTTNMDYGRLAPSAYEINTRWFPNNNTFTREMPGGPYRNQSLRTAVNRNKVHDFLDGFN